MTLYRQLAAARPDAFTPDLAMSLNNLSGALAALGRWEEALAAIEEAVTLYRQLAAVRPDEFTPDLTKSLSNLAIRWPPGPAGGRAGRRTGGRCPAWVTGDLGRAKEMSCAARMARFACRKQPSASTESSNCAIRLSRALRRPSAVRSGDGRCGRLLRRTCRGPIRRVVGGHVRPSCRAEAVADVLAGLADGDRALELGIGPGRIALSLACRGIPVHGIDMSQAMDFYGDYGIAPDRRQ